MRKPEYLSPTSLALWLDNKEKFYLRYMADNKPPREPQTFAMSVGSSFDAYVKCYLHACLFGNGLDFEDLFEKQVEPQNRDMARVAGERLFEKYKEVGAAADLLLLLSRSVSEPKFEFEVRGEIGGVPVLGKPDLWWESEDGDGVNLDWKVNGYEKFNKYPSKGYVKLRGDHKKAGNCHKDAWVVNGVNTGHKLEQVDETWARQLVTYSMLCGLGSGFLAAIDQIVCGVDGISVAEHRCYVGKDFWDGVVKGYQDCWKEVQEGNVVEEGVAKVLDNFYLNTGAKRDYFR